MSIIVESDIGGSVVSSIEGATSVIGCIGVVVGAGVVVVDGAGGIVEVGGAGVGVVGVVGGLPVSNLSRVSSSSSYSNDISILDISGTPVTPCSVPSSSDG